MINPPENIKAKAVKIRQCLLKGLLAVEDEEVKAYVEQYAEENPQIEWDPFSLAACAIDYANVLAEKRAKAKVLPVVQLSTEPPPPPQSPRDGRGIFHPVHKDDSLGR